MRTDVGNGWPTFLITRCPRTRIRLTTVTADCRSGTTSHCRSRSRKDRFHKQSDFITETVLQAHIKKIHLLIGVLGVVIFLLTGQYMRHFIHSAMEQSDRLRFSTRANHVYILMSALLNLSLGSYLRMNVVRWRTWLQVIGSLLIIGAIVILIGAFFYEPKDGLDRPFT